MIKNILFEFDSYKLNDQAITSLDALRAVLSDYPDLKIEVTGYTDSKGSAEYNMKLAGKRADEVIGYLTKAGIPSSRLVKKVYGSSEFVAVNTNSDGSDNPDARKYNRRASFGIIDPKTGIMLRQETYTPRHLRHPSSFKYCVVLTKTVEELEPNQFKNLEIPASIFINPLRIGSTTSYVIGEFISKVDAVRYLSYAKEKGFKDAYIVTQYDMNKPLPETDDELSSPAPGPEARIYTIQLAASRKPMDMSYFKDIEGVREIYSSDNYYRYVTGEYNSVTKAKPLVAAIREAGFRDAYIRLLKPISE